MKKTLKNRLRSLGVLLLLAALLLSACGPKESVPSADTSPVQGTLNVSPSADSGASPDTSDGKTGPGNLPEEDTLPSALPDDVTTPGYAPGDDVSTTPESEPSALPDVSETPEEPSPEDTASPEPDYSDKLPAYGEYYYDLTNVVLYIEVYGELPPNFITKNEARKLGWSGGSVEKYKEGAAIGGDYFGNFEGLLPEAKGRSYTECDIDTDGYSSRGSRRLVFSNDGLYFYSSDHYESFTEVTVTEDYEVVK